MSSSQPSRKSGRARKAPKFLLGTPDKSEGGGSDSEDNVSTSEAYDDIGDDDDDDNVDFGEKGSKRKKGKATKKGGRGNSKIAKVSIGPNDMAISGDIASGRAAVEDVNGTNHDEEDDDDYSMGGGTAVDVDGAGNYSVEHRTLVTSSVSELVSAASNLSSQLANNESGKAFANRLIEEINRTQQAVELSADLGKLWGGEDFSSLVSHSAPDDIEIENNISHTLSCGVGPGTMSARSEVDEENFGSLLQHFNGINVSTGEGSRETMHYPHECIAFAQIRDIYSHNLKAQSKKRNRADLENYIKSILESFELQGFQFSTLANQVTVVLDVLEFGKYADNSHEFESLTPGFQHAFREMWTEENTYGADDDYNGDGDGKMDESEILEREIEGFHDDEEVVRDS